MDAGLDIAGSLNVGAAIGFFYIALYLPRMQYILN